MPPAPLKNRADRFAVSSEHPAPSPLVSKNSRERCACSIIGKPGAAGPRAGRGRKSGCANFPMKSDDRAGPKKSLNAFGVDEI